MSFRETLVISCFAVVASQSAVADLATPPWPSAEGALSQGVVNGVDHSEFHVDLDSNFDFVSTMTNADPSQKVYSKVNIYNDEGSHGGYFTNFKTYYETWGPAGPPLNYQQSWGIHGTYDFAPEIDKIRTVLGSVA